MNGHWRIELLGGLRIVRGDRALARFGTRKDRALLAYLAYYPHRAHPRDALIDLLWPDAAPSSARNSLSKALSSLRRLLDPPGERGVLLADHASVQIDPSKIATDVAEFQAALDAARAAGSEARAAALATAVDLYTGDLLPELYDDWVLRERGWLAERFFQALESLTAAMETAGDLRTALEQARRGIALDPTREEICRCLMRLYAATGQPALARRQFAEFEQSVRSVLGAGPSPATVALLQQIEAGERQEGARGRAAAPRSHVARRTSQDEQPATRDARPPPAFGGYPARDRPLSLPHYLPAPLTRFFGREAEVAAIGRLLREEGRRLVTLTGPGGSGKTRLALEAARRLQEQGWAAVWFVPLADLNDGQRIGEAIRDALRLPSVPGVELMEQVIAALSRRPSLLVLDNLEHLLDPAAGFLRCLLEQAPALACLATSRERLRLAGERELLVLPLSVPDEVASVERLMACDSVRLFCDRARDARLEFALTAANARAVGSLCRQLEGIPLAIELAAARVGVLSPAEMQAQKGRRFALLVSGMREAASRHRSLWTALEWSYRMLSPEQQRLFARLCVFQGGWTARAAAAVCAEGAPAGRAEAGEVGTVDAATEELEQLRACSLIQVEAQAGERRYRMLETLREFGAAQLSAAEREALQQSHARFYLALAEEVEANLVGAESLSWLDRLEKERDNLRAALAWLTEREEAAAGLRLAWALSRFWGLRGYLAEGREHLTRLLGMAGAAERTVVRARALHGAGAIADAQGDLEAARAFFEESLSIYRELGDRPGIAAAGLGLGGAVHFLGDAETARACFEESLTIFRELGDRSGVARALLQMGNIAHRQGDLDAAHRFYEESLTLHRETGDKRCISGALFNLACVAGARRDRAAERAFVAESLAISREIDDRVKIAIGLYVEAGFAFDDGDLELAESLWEESLAMMRELQHRLWLPGPLGGLGRVAQARGDYRLAKRLYEEGLLLQRQNDDWWGTVMSLGYLADLACLQEEYGAARAHYEEALAISREQESRGWIASSLRNLAKVALVQGDDETARACLRESLSLRREQNHPAGLAECLEELARLASVQGRAERAARLFGAAQTRRLAIRAADAAGDHPTCDADVAALRAALGDERFATAWAEGRAMSLEESVDYALQEGSEV